MRHISKAQELFEEGIKKTAEMFVQYPEVMLHDDKIVDALVAVYYWKEIHKLNGTTPPTDFPLAEFVENHRPYQSEVEKAFLQETN